MILPIIGLVESLEDGVPMTDVHTHYVVQSGRTFSKERLVDRKSK